MRALKGKILIFKYLKVSSCSSEFGQRDFNHEQLWIGSDFEIEIQMERFLFLFTQKRIQNRQNLTNEKNELLK